MDIKKKTLLEQIKSCKNTNIYNAITVNNLTQIILDITASKEKKHKMSMELTKYGLIQFQLALMKKEGVSRYKINKERKHLEETIEEGFYRITNIVDESAKYKLKNNKNK